MSGGRNILDRERFKLKNQPLRYSGCFFDFGFDPDRSEAAASRHLNANAVAEDDCPGDVIQRRNATTPNRATVPPMERAGRHPPMLRRPEESEEGSANLLHRPLRGSRGPGPASR